MSITLRPARSAFRTALEVVHHAPARAGRRAATSVVEGLGWVVALVSLVPWRSIAGQATEKLGATLIAGAGWQVDPALGMLVAGAMLVLAANANALGRLLAARALARGDE
ncbi:MAG: hypothetical protein AAGA93_26945 [Actinomycetota bacterium]